MKVVDYLFGERISTRMAKAVFYAAWFSMLLNFFDFRIKDISWVNMSMPLLLLAFLVTGGFMTFASREGLIDYWRPKSRLGRYLQDPAKSPTTVCSMRLTGVVFLLAISYTVFSMMRITKTANTYHLSGR